MTATSTIHPQTKTKMPPTVNVILRKAHDGSTELIVDVSGGFDCKDALKKQDFQFVQDRSSGICSEAPLDKNGNRKKTPVWRLITAAVAPDTNTERLTNALNQAIQKIEMLAKDVLSGARIKGAKTAALKLADNWSGVSEIAELSQRLAAMETPWQPDVRN